MFHPVLPQVDFTLFIFPGHVTVILMEYGTRHEGGIFLKLQDPTVKVPMGRIEDIDDLPISRWKVGSVHVDQILAKFHPVEIGFPVGEGFRHVPCHLYRGVSLEQPFHDFHAFLEREIPPLLERWKKERKT